MKIGIILPYFGGFNSYFHIWMNTVRNNPEIDWLLFTDQIINTEIPSNCIIYSITFSELKKLFESKFNTKIYLKTPYKLCDYKPYYGFLFSEYLKDYDFWGYCDCDLIFGNIRTFITDELLEKYDKLLRRGHFSLIRNSEDINQNFMAFDTYKTVITSPVIYGYDESIKGYHLGFAGELMEKGYRFYDEKRYIADIDFRHFPFFRIENTEQPLAFKSHSGKLYELSVIGNRISEEEIMYVHFQKRFFDEVTEDVDKDIYIIPNRMIACDSITMNPETLLKLISTEKPGYYDVYREKMDSIKRDIKRFIYEPKKLNSILYRVFGHRKHR